MCDSGKWETFCERSKKEQSARKISRCARNDGMVYIALCEIAEKGKPFAKGARKSRVQGRFLAALEMTVWCISSYVRQRKTGIHLRRKQEKVECKDDFSTLLEMTVGGIGLFHVAYNGYVWKTLFLYRHPERSRGIFLAGGDNVVCVIVENGKPFAKGARSNKVQGRFLATLEMTVWCIASYV